MMFPLRLSPESQRDHCQLQIPPQIRPEMVTLITGSRDCPLSPFQLLTETSEDGTVATGRRVARFCLLYFTKGVVDDVDYQW